LTTNVVVTASGFNEVTEFGYSLSQSGGLVSGGLVSGGELSL
jgi:hypothetical protein